MARLRNGDILYGKLSLILCRTAAFIVFFIGPPNGSQR